MALDLEEQEQLASFKAWWNDNGTMVVLVMTALLLTFSGWQGWRWYQQRDAAAAGALYQSLVKAAKTDDAKAVRDASGTLIEQHARHLYASMGALVNARYLHDRNDLKGAKAQLQWVVERSQSESLRDVARLRLAAILLDEKDHAGALSLLQEPYGESFAARFTVLRGDVLVAQGKQEPARAAYRKALELAAQDDRAFVDALRMRLDALGGGG